MKNFTKYGQYKGDFFGKLAIDFVPKTNLLDIGCGDCTDAEIFLTEYDLDVYGIDIYEHENVKDLPNFHFNLAGIYQIPFENDFFDNVFLHDVLHHIDEKEQSYENHIKGLREVKRITKPSGKIIIAEGNRYNPLFYPHMVKMHGHDHFTQPYFKKIMQDTFKEVNYMHFEAHLYPSRFIRFWKIYDLLMDKYSPKHFLAYNVAIITND